MTRIRWIPTAILAAVLLGTARAEEPKQLAPQPRVILPGYKTVATAKQADPNQFKNTPSAVIRPAGYLGITLSERNGKAIVDAVEPGSPADKAGIKEGDEISSLEGANFPSTSILREALRARLSGDVVKMVVVRENQAIQVAATLVPTTNPMTVGPRAILGITPAAGPSGNGVKVESLTPNGPAEMAGVKSGDLLLKLDGNDVQDRNVLDQLLAGKKPGDRVELIIERDGNRLEKQATLVSDQPGSGRPGFGPGGGGGLTTWQKPVYRLAIIGIEYPDVKHHDKVKDCDWDDSIFSFNTYKGKNATGQDTYGSMNDFLREISYGKLKVEGKFAGWVEVSKKRTEYATGTGISPLERTKLLVEAYAKFKEKNKDGLKDYDGVFFLYAGATIPNISRGSLYWPHRSTVTLDGKRVPYFIVNEMQQGGTRMTNISVFCHEFGHMLGLPDLYARPEQPGSEGVWRWCLMSNQIPTGQPQHPSAWCKERLGWVKPVMLDPRDKQKLILAPIWNDPTQCFKVAIRPDGSEYFLLENRVKKGWDSQLPGEGLLIWRVFAGRRPSNNPDLPTEQQQPVYVEESHGVLGPEGPRSFPSSVPFPSAANRSFTPFTIPSSRSLLGGALPVYITNIQRLPDGRIAFHIGYEYQ